MVEDWREEMKRLLLAALGGVALAAGVFVAVVALTDVSVTIDNPTPTDGELGVSAFGGRTPPPCARSAGLVFRLNQPQGATGALMIPVSVSLASGTPCTLDADARFAVQTQVGTTSIQGNPQSFHLQGAIRKQTGVGAIFAWRNWCGPDGWAQFKLTVVGRGSTTWRDRLGTPPCEAPGSGTPSTLDLAAGSG
jgi:hypothetical protein